MSDHEPQEPQLKITDRRGQPKEERRPAFRPDVVTDIRDTDDPLVKIAVMPGNRVQEHQFKLSRMEARGFALLARQVKGIGPDGQRAVHAARMKVLKVIEKAMKMHMAGPDKSPQVQGPKAAQ